MFKNTEELWQAVERGLITMKRAQEWAEIMTKIPMVVRSTTELSDEIAGLYEARMFSRAGSVIPLTSTEAIFPMVSCSTDWSGGDMYTPKERFATCSYCGYDNAWERGACDQCGAPLVHTARDRVEYKDVVNAVEVLSRLEPTNQFNEPVIKPSLWQDIINLVFGRKE